MVHPVEAAPATRRMGRPPVVGVTAGWTLIVLGALCALAVPSSREAGRRIFYVLCVAIGMAPLVVWLPLPVDGLTRWGWGTAAIAGTLVALLAARRMSWRRLLPRFRAADVPALLGVGFTAWCLQPLWAVGDASHALRLLRLGWDHAAHFNMVEMIRRSGSLAGLVEPGEFESMAYRNYPKGFHAGAATVMDVTVGRSVLDPSAELMGYAQ